MDKKKKIYSAIAGVFFLIISYWLIQKLVSHDNGESWSFIPNSAIVVVESSHMNTQWEEVKSQEITTFLKNFELIDQFTPQFVWLDSILRTKEYTLDDLLGEKKGMVSFHFLPTRRIVEEIVYLPLLEQDKSFIDVLSTFFGDEVNGYTLQQKQVNNGEYWVLNNSSKGTDFFFLIQDNIFIGTYSSDLIKEVLTQIETEENDLLIQKQNHDAKNNQEQHTQMYVNLPLLSKMLSHYVAPEDKDLLAALELFAEHTFFNVKLNNKTLLLHGFTYNTHNWAFLNCFNEQKPMPFELSSLISNRTLTLSYLGVDDGLKLQEKMKAYWWDRGIDMEENWSQIEGEKQIEYTELYEELHGMIAYATVENPNTHILERILYLPSNNIQRMEELYTNFAKSTYSDIDDMKITKYEGYEIIPMNIHDFSYLMFGEYFKGFENTYFTKIQNNIVMASSKQALKLLIDDINEEVVWSRSSSHIADLEELFSSANVGLYINPNRTFKILKNVLSLEGKNLLQQNHKQLNPIKALSLQFSADQKGEFYTDWGIRIGKVGKIVTNHSTSSNTSSSTHKYELWRQDLDQPLITKPFVVINHETKQREIFIQDKKNHVILLSNNGKVLWDVDVKNPIIGEIHQIDIYKNGKLQYLFTTKDNVYCLDRRGRNVTNFPFSVNNDQIKSMTLIDYDGSKKYRILVATNQQELRMYDIKGKNLKGWDPQKIEGVLVTPPLHMRVKGRDVIFALQQNGKAYLWNRRGKSINKFPKDLEEGIHAPIFTAKGKNINESTFSFTTVSGKIQKYNFKGAQLFTKDMAKNGESLHMILSPDHKEYTLVKQTDKLLYFYNSYLREQFFIPKIDNYQVSKAQYYPIKKGKNLYVNYSDQKAYFHLEENKVFIEQEIATPQKMSLIYYTNSNKYIVYKVEGTKIIAEEVKDLKKLH